MNYSAASGGKLSPEAIKQHISYAMRDTARDTAEAMPGPGIAPRPRASFGHRRAPGGKRSRSAAGCGPGQPMATGFCYHRSLGWSARQPGRLAMTYRER